MRLWMHGYAARCISGFSRQIDLNMTKIYLKKKRDESLRRFHPWVFSGAVDRIDGSPQEGEVVEVYSFEKEFMAYGHYQVGSITVRVLGFAGDDPKDFWKNRISDAFNVRKALGLAESNDTNAYRLVHGEGDNLPGLIVDYYNGVAVIQAHSVGMYKSRDKITQALKSVYGDKLKAVYDKSSGTAPFKAIENLHDGYLYGDPIGSMEISENGNRFAVDWEEGQKTGFFLDQRENRALVGKYSKGRKVLNLFCYTGGFSIYALANGAASVDSVDSSARAIAMAERNAALNSERISGVHSAHCCDAIDFLKDSEYGRYDLIVVDPPAFAKHRGSLDTALRAYRRLNASAISKVAPGGIIFTYSCSQVVDRNAFSNAVFTAAAQAGRKVRILYRLMQASDHPVNIYHPEGEYLKGLALYVE